VANWGERLIGVSRSASREAVAGGKLADMLMSSAAKERSSASRAFPMPKIDASQKSRSTVEVSVSDWSAVSPTLDVALGKKDVLFRAVDGKLVVAELISAFKGCASWKDMVAGEMSREGAEGEKPVLESIRLISDALAKAMKCGDKGSLKAVLQEMDFLR
jgi:hypothetical protein